MAAILFNIFESQLKTVQAYLAATEEISLYPWNSWVEKRSWKTVA
jgi:hypothetical protein